MAPRLSWVVDQIDVAVLIHQADGGDGFVAALDGVFGFVVADTDAGGIAHVRTVAAAGAAQVGARIDAVGALVGFGKHQVFGRPAQDGVGFVLFLGQDE